MIIPFNLQELKDFGESRQRELLKDWRRWLFSEELDRLQALELDGLAYFCDYGHDIRYRESDELRAMLRAQGVL